MKKASMVVAGIVGLVSSGAVMAQAPGEDPIKDGQNIVSSRMAAAGEDPIKDGQNIMAAKGADLGAPAPSRPNLSRSGEWDAYAYARDGVQYVQVNDPNGVVHAVIGTAHGRVFSLPLGVDADSVHVSGQIGATVVFNDGAIEISTTNGVWYVRSVNQ